MADLESKLKKIESALGGDKDTPEVYDKLGWHLDYIEELVQEGGDIELKTINGQDLHGEGDIEIKTYQPFGASWPTTSTTKAFCDAIDVDELATVGNAYLGDASFSDLPFSGNGDVEVQIMNGPNNSKAIHLVLTSGNVAPYRWEYTYWNSGSSTSDWKGFQPELAAQTPYTSKGSSTKVPQITTNALGQVTNIVEVDIPDGNDNQTIKVGATTFGANESIDLVAGSNVSLTATTTGEGAPKITIEATDTTYSQATISSVGLMPQLESASVSTQDQTTKFMREEGTWSAPSYTDVEANPVLVGSESELGSVQVGSTKYKVTTSSDVASAVNAAVYDVIDANY